MKKPTAKTSPSLERLVEAVRCYVPEGSMRPGDIESVDVGALMARSGLAREEVQTLARHLAKPLGLAKASFRNKQDVLRLTAEPRPAVPSNEDASTTDDKHSFVETIEWFDTATRPLPPEDERSDRFLVVVDCNASATYVDIVQLDEAGLYWRAAGYRVVRWARLPDGNRHGAGS